MATANNSVAFGNRLVSWQQRHRRFRGRTRAGANGIGRDTLNRIRSAATRVPREGHRRHWAAGCDAKRGMAWNAAHGLAPADQTELQPVAHGEVQRLMTPSVKPLARSRDAHVRQPSV